MANSLLGLTVVDTKSHYGDIKPIFNVFSAERSVGRLGAYMYDHSPSVTYNLTHFGGTSKSVQ